MALNYIENFCASARRRKNLTIDFNGECGYDHLLIEREIAMLITNSDPCPRTELRHVSLAGMETAELSGCADVQVLYSLIERHPAALSWAI